MPVPVSGVKSEDLFPIRVAKPHHSVRVERSEHVEETWEQGDARREETRGVRHACVKAEQASEGRQGREETPIERMRCSRTPLATCSK